MKCSFCGFESETDFAFCPSCGKEAPTEIVEIAENSNPAAALVLSVIKDKLFFVLCVLLTAGSALALFSGSFNVIAILATIFAWIVYYSAINSNIADVKNLRCISGTVYANYIINNVSAIILCVCSVILLLLSSVLANSGELVGEITDLLQDELPEFLSEFGEMFIATFSFLVVILLVIVAAVTLVFNILGLRNIHKFVKSAYTSAESGVMSFEKCKTASTWLMVFGVLEGISALSALGDSFFGFLSAASLAAVQIIASILIKKHFEEFM